MPYTVDMNRCTGPKDWAEAHGVKTIGCRHACRLSMNGTLHAMCAEERVCRMDPEPVPLAVCAWDDWKPGRDVS
jgi:hypothetical protein